MENQLFEAWLAVIKEWAAEQQRIHSPRIIYIAPPAEEIELELERVEAAIKEHARRMRPIQLAAPWLALNFRTSCALPGKFGK